MTHPRTDAQHQWTAKEIVATLAWYHDRLQAVDLGIIWDVVQNKLPGLRRAVTAILESLEHGTPPV